MSLVSLTSKSLVTLQARGSSGQHYFAVIQPSPMTFVNHGVVSDADNDWIVVSYYFEESRQDNDHHQHHYSNCRHHVPKTETTLLLVKRWAFAFNLYGHPM
jgi:hypothetical protein